jgi:hypothetical protein
MVNTSYFLNDELAVRDSTEIITMTKRGGGITSRLPANWVVGLNDHFFAGLSGQMNRGEEIDTFITPTLYHLPASTADTFRLQTQGPVTPADIKTPMHPPLPELTLRRGSNRRLPSGQEFARYFHLKSIVPPEHMGASSDDQKFLHATGMDERTPLWYYLLREAAVQPNYEAGIGPDPPIAKLGRLGSRIVAEVIYQILHNDAESVFNAGKHWRPPFLQFGTSARLRPIDSMPVLIEFAQSV